MTDDQKTIRKTIQISLSTITLFYYNIEKLSKNNEYDVQIKVILSRGKHENFLLVQ